jgi:hypothetical protein
MRKSVVLVIALLLVTVSGCAKHNKTKVEPAEVVQESYDVTFLGYKAAIKVKASPEELEKFLLTPSGLLESGGLIKLKQVSDGELKQKGDTILFKAQMAGIKTDLREVLWKLDPGKEVFIIIAADNGMLAFLRYNFKKLEDGAKLDITFEVEESNPLVKQLVATMKLDEFLKKAQDNTMARIKIHFDPSLAQQTLEENAPVGEMTTKYYVARKTTVWVDETPQNVAEYAASEDFRQFIKERYNLDFQNAFIDRKPGLYKIKTDFLGVKVEPDFMVLNYDYAKFVQAYMEGNLQSVIQVSFMPDKGGTQVSLAYMLDSPTSFSAEISSTLANTIQIPKYVGMALTEAKQEVEKRKKGGN